MLFVPLSEAEKRLLTRGGHRRPSRMSSLIIAEPLRRFLHSLLPELEWPFEEGRSKSRSLGEWFYYNILSELERRLFSLSLL